MSSRIQHVIDQGYGTFYGFRKLLEKQGRGSLASTVRGWLPPQRRWKERPNGAAVRPEDWNALKLPDSGTLIEFCEVTNASPGYLLLGEGVSLRGQNRDVQTLEQDFAAAVRREVLQRIASGRLGQHMRAMSSGPRRYLREQIVVPWLVLPSDLSRKAILRCADEVMASTALMVQSLVSGYYAAVVDDARKRIARIDPIKGAASAQEVAENLREVVTELRRQVAFNVHRQFTRRALRVRNERIGGLSKEAAARTGRTGRQKRS